MVVLISGVFAALIILVALVFLELSLLQLIVLYYLSAAAFLLSFFGLRALFYALTKREEAAPKSQRNAVDRPDRGHASGDLV